MPHAVVSSQADERASTVAHAADPEPDVWWGEGGIDALIWPKPYVVSTPDRIPDYSRKEPTCPASSAATTNQSPPLTSA